MNILPSCSIGIQPTKFAGTLEQAASRRQLEQSSPFKKAPSFAWLLSSSGKTRIDQWRDGEKNGLFLAQALRRALSTSVFSLGWAMVSLRLNGTQGRVLMFRKFLKSKIHRCLVTQADLDYEGSLTIPPELLRAAGIAPFEAVVVWNITRGSRLETYAIQGIEGERDICANGAAAHLIRPGDLIIVATFQFIPHDMAEAAAVEPRVVFVDDQNRMTHLGKEIPGPRRRGTSPSLDSCC